MEIFDLKYNAEDLDDKAMELAELHMKAFPDFFLTQLGIGFLTIVYKGYLSDSESGIIVAEDHGKVAGFLAYSNDYSGFFRNLLHRKALYFGWYAFAAVIKHPAYAKRLLSALKKSDEVRRTEPYVELASICVDRSSENQGIGSGLIQALIQNVDFTAYAYVSLETDADENERVNRFYRKNGFALARTFVTPEGRK